MQAMNELMGSNLAAQRQLLAQWSQQEHQCKNPTLLHTCLSFSHSVWATLEHCLWFCNFEDASDENVCSYSDHEVRGVESWGFAVQWLYHFSSATILSHCRRRNSSQQILPIRNISQLKFSILSELNSKLLIFCRNALKSHYWGVPLSWLGVLPTLFLLKCPSVEC